MSRRIAKILLVFAAIIVTFAGHGMAQSSADNLPMNRSSWDDKEERPKSIRDSLEKMRIEKEKKDFDRMIERGEEAVKIAAELEGAIAKNGRLSEREMAKLASVEKLAKQIRSELGGNDDADDDDEQKSPPAAPSSSVSVAVKSLRNSAEDLYRELKKISRFSISATAIQCSNAVVRLARFARGVR